MLGLPGRSYMRRFICFLVMTSILMIGVFTGCVPGEKKDDGKISVVATCFPPYDFARAVAGDTADITMLLSTGAEAHSYEPTPRDIAEIQNCDVFICIGGEDEVWVDKILDAIDNDSLTVIRLFDYAELLEEEAVAGASPNGHDHQHQHSEEEHEGDVSEEEADGHIWTSPANAVRCVQAIEDVLCEKYSENAGLYRSRGEEYIQRLEQLDRDFSEATENAADKLIVIGDRFPFRYLAHEYGLEYFAAFSGCSSESEPSVYTMAFLINEILEHDADTVFYLEFSTKKLAEKLCDATGAKMLPLNSCHNVSRKDFENGVTYIDLMYENLENLKEALS